MNWTKRIVGRLAGWTIGSQLMLAFGVVLLLTGLLGVMSYLALGEVKRGSQELADKWMPAVGHMAAARTGILEVREFEAKHSRAADAGYMSEYEEKAGVALASIASSVAAFHALADDTDEQKLIAEFDRNWADYLVVNKKVLALGRAGKQDDAKDIGDGAAKMAADDTIGALDRLSAYEFAGAKAAGERAVALYARTKLAMLGFVAITLLIGLSLAVGITRGLLKQLGGEPRTAVDVARAVAAGDLTMSFAIKPGDHSSLMAALRDMQQSLAGVVATVHRESAGVASSSAEIAQGNRDLAGHTEQQAGALGETAASMAQLDETVKRNVDSARQADELARTASEVASKGGQAVAQVVDTMKGINESSRKIGDITGVIDSIAFQTNILALNAAVEAARAGDQGRGFAVVASEVRSLAQRSAEAAKQIKALIGDSLVRVDQGSAQVDRAGATMGEVVAAIQRVTQIVSEISTASLAQSSGVRQVSEAVSQMDHTTQRNAALVEQSAAAAESLKLQAEHLVQAVAVFRLGSTSIG